MPIRARHRRIRGGKTRGEPSAHLPRADFVNFLQNHDQIGNRPMGERLAVLAEAAALEAALAVLLLQPGPPLMFMGDEWGATEPFPFFCDFKGDLARSGAQRPQARIRRSLCRARRRNSRPAGAGNARGRRARLADARSKPAHAARLALTRALLAARASNGWCR